MFRKENSSAGPKCPVRGLAEASLLPSGPAEGPMEENEVVQQRMLINDPTAGAGPTCPVRGLAETSLSPSGPAQGPLGESDVAKDLIEKQSKMIDEEVVKIQKGNNGKVGQIFKIAKQLKGEATNQAHAIKDPETKRLVVEQSEIKSISLKFCKKVLERNEPKKEMEKMFEMRKTLNEERLSENVGEGFKASKDVYDQVLAKFKSNNKRSYDFGKVQGLHLPAVQEDHRK